MFFFVSKPNANQAAAVALIFAWRCSASFIVVSECKSAMKNKDKVDISVTNDFRKLNGKSKDAGYGIGIANIRRRLEQVYGKDYSFEQSIEESRFISKISIPFELYLND